jgi:hypothetical protein
MNSEGFFKDLVTIALFLALVVIMEMGEKPNMFGYNAATINVANECQ